MGRISLSASLLLLLTLAQGPSLFGDPATPAPAVTPKPKIERADDLPRFTYALSGTSEEILNNTQGLLDVAEKIRTDTENTLANYDIEDKTALKRLKDILLSIDVLENKNDEARALITDLRNLEDKPALKDMTGLFLTVRLETTENLKSGDLTQPAFQTMYRKILEDRLEALPWEEVQDEIKESKGGMEQLNKNLILGGLTSELDPVLKKTAGQLSTDMVMALIDTKNELTNSVPLKDALLDVLTKVVANHTTVKPEIWSARAVTFTPDDKLNPVVVGIWDSGVDDTLFPNQLYTNPNEIPNNNIDDDHNGFVDDVHGIAFDLHSNKVTGSLYPMGDDVKQLDELKTYIKGSLDSEAAIDSPEKKALLDKLASLSRSEVQPFEENLDKFDNFLHGTHVATISSLGNPFARLLIARITFDYHTQPEMPTVEQSKKDAAASVAAVDYFKAHDVRVVNMSWGGDLAGVESGLEMNGMTDVDARKKLAREIFTIDHDALFDALKNAPNILFIIAAGNGNNNVDFDEDYPSSFQLPNIVTVGAVDQAGDPTSFTSFGKNVFIYADGFQVDGMIPGGTHLALSGTSMAAPEVTNLAAKLFAIDPKLTPTEVVDLIKAACSPGTDKRVNLIDPKKTIELLKAKMGAAKP